MEDSIHGILLLDYSSERLKLAYNKVVNIVSCYSHSLSTNTSKTLLSILCVLEAIEMCIASL